MTIRPHSQREELLQQATACVIQDRNKQYGPPEDSFNSIAALWNVYLSGKLGISVELHAVDIANLMILLKIARLQANPNHWDSKVDIAGYAACSAEMKILKEEEPGIDSLLDKLKEVNDVELR